MGDTARAARERGRATTRALAVLGLLLATGTLFAVRAEAVHDEGLFELDRNAVNDGLVAGEDWDQVCPDGAAFDVACVGGTTASQSAFVLDPDGATIFTGGGSKDDLDVPQWRHTSGSVPDKDELMYGMAARYDVGEESFLYFGANRFAANGDAQIGIWFFQSQVGLDPDNPGQFTGVHRDGDLLVLSDFTQGGTQPTIRVFRWNGPGGTIAGAGTINGTLDLLAGDEDNPVDCLNPALADDPACATVNVVNTPSPWLFKAKPNNAPQNVFIPGTFYEGGVDLSDPDIDLADECFSSFIIETRSSQSVDAVLKDFLGGDFQSCGADLVTTPSSTSFEIGGSVTDTAAITVTGGGTPPAPTGTVDFYVCGPLAADALCDTGGTLVSTEDLAGATANGNTYSVTSDSFTPTSAGRWCFRATWAGDDNYIDGPYEDSAENECFVVTPRQPAISTQATAGPVPLGSSIDDVATLSNTAPDPDGSVADGTITFTAYGPHSDTTTCTTVAYTSVVNVAGDGSYTASTGTGGTFTPTSPGTYNWIAVYSGDPPNTLGVSGSCGDANEGSVVLQLNPAIATEQSFIPNDEATITVAAGGGNLAGSVRFRLYDNAICSGTALYDQTVAVSGASPQTVNTTNAGGVSGYTITGDGTYSWFVEYSSTNPAHTGVDSACHVEHTVIDITNG
jgi:hypothetical protein